MEPKLNMDQKLRTPQFTVLNPEQHYKDDLFVYLISLDELCVLSLGVVCRQGPDQTPWRSEAAP